MFSRLFRRWTPQLMRPLMVMLARAGVSANGLTAAGLAGCALAGVLIAMGSLVAAGCLVLLSGILDAMDGELARQTGTASPYGAFLDSVADHYGDLAIYLGIAWSLLQAGNAAFVMATMLAMFGSVMGSHVRSRGGLLGLDTKDVGLFTRAERIFVLVVGLLTGWIEGAIAVLAVANNVSALQRLVHLMASATRTRERDIAA